MFCFYSFFFPPVGQWGVVRKLVYLVCFCEINTGCVVEVFEFVANTLGFYLITIFLLLGCNEDSFYFLFYIFALVLASFTDHDYLRFIQVACISCSFLFIAKSILLYGCTTMFLFIHLLMDTWVVSRFGQL